MKEQGKVEKYNGYYGEITNNKKEKYLLLKEEIISDMNEYNQLKEGDEVIFKPETYKNSVIEQKIARFVRVIKK